MALTKVQKELIAASNVARYQYDTSNGYGSTATKIRKFSNATQSSDPSSLLTIANDATNGFSITANRACKIDIMYSEMGSAAMNFGISKNSSDVTTSITGISVATRVVITATFSGGVCSSTTASDIAAANDVYRPHADATAAGATPAQVCIYIVAREIS